MPEQFPYPTDGWSTGKMRKKGDRMRQGLEGDVGDAARNFENSPLINSIEKMHQERMKAQGIPEQMKMYAPRSGVGASEVRELEGIRKEKTQHLSQAKELPQEDWNKYWQSGGWEVIGKSHKVDPSKASPDGVVIEHNHPQIDELKEKGWESFDIPDEGWSKKGIFMKPPAKSPEVA